MHGFIKESYYVFLIVRSTAITYERRTHTCYRLIYFSPILLMLHIMSVFIQSMILMFSMQISHLLYSIGVHT